MNAQTRTVSEIAEELKASADAWDQSARWLGNVTAGEIGELCRWCLAAIEDRPRLAPEHVEALRRTQGKLYCSISLDLKDAIRAALAALVEA